MFLWSCWIWSAVSIVQFSVYYTFRETSHVIWKRKWRNYSFIAMVTKDLLFNQYSASFLDCEWLLKCYLGWLSIINHGECFLQQFTDKIHFALCSQSFFLSLVIHDCSVKKVLQLIIGIGFNGGDTSGKLYPF